jgi:predicted ATP-dependent endonuclease of OLD family
MNFRQEITELAIKKQEKIFQLTEKRATIDVEKVVYERQIRAKFVLVEVSRQTQEQLKERIESLVNMCLKAVFPNRDYQFKALFEIKRNKMECEFTVLEDGNELSPKDEMGGSILDIISLALKIILWSIEQPRSRPLIILDEPFRFTGKLVTKAIGIVKEFSHKLGIQFIINTHSDEVIDIADRSWEVTRPVGKKSIVIQTS